MVFSFSVDPCRRWGSGWFRLSLYSGREGEWLCDVVMSEIRASSSFVVPAPTPSSFSRSVFLSLLSVRGTRRGILTRNTDLVKERFKVRDTHEETIRISIHSCREFVWGSKVIKSGVSPSQSQDDDVMSYPYTSGERDVTDGLPG